MFSQPYLVSKAIAVTDWPIVMVALGFALLLSLLHGQSLAEPSRDAVAKSALSGLHATPQMMRAWALKRCFRVKGNEPAYTSGNINP